MNSTERQHELYREYLKSEAHRENLRRLGLVKETRGTYDMSGDTNVVSGRAILYRKKAHAGRA